MKQINYKTQAPGQKVLDFMLSFAEASYKEENVFLARLFFTSLFGQVRITHNNTLWFYYEPNTY